MATSTCFSLAPLVCGALLLWPAANPCHAITPQAGDAGTNAAALREVRYLAGLTGTPEQADAEHLAAALHVELAAGSCRDTNLHEHYCEFQIGSQASTVGRLLIVALGRNKRTGMPGGRIVWATWNKQVCLTAAALSALLGPGELAQVSIPYVPPNASTLPPAYRDIAYTRIPGAVPGASAMASYVNACVSELSIDF